MCVAIVGSGRSGTSLVARLLNICGMNIGDTSAMAAPNEHNQKGYWEPPSIIHINTLVLSHYGGAYDRPPDLPPGWQNDRDLDHLYAMGRQALQSEFGGTPIYGFKDPRATLTLPFWKKLVPDLKVVICMRSPIDVAKSVGKWSISHKYGYVIWHLYTLQALYYTQPESRIITFYDDYYEDVRSALNPVLGFVGLDEIEDGSPKHSEVAQFFDKRLSHHRSSVADLFDDLVPAATRDLFLDILAKGELGVIDSQLQTFRHFNSLLCQMARIQADCGHAESHAEWLESILASRTHRIASRVCDFLIKHHTTRKSNAPVG